MNECKPLVAGWATSTTLKAYSKSLIKGYYGRNVQFYVTAQDDDDCTEVSVGGCRLIVSTPVLKAPVVSAHEAEL